MSRIMINIAQSVSANGAKLQTWAKVAGMSARDFAAAWKTSPAKALDAVFVGLGRMQKSGQDVFGVLADVDAQNIRTTQTLLSVASAGGLVTDQVNLANQAWADNTQLATSAAQRYDTVAAKTQIAKNAIADSAITIGNSMGSAFQTAAANTDEPLREVMETAASLSRSAKELDAALAHVSRLYGLKELYMVAAVVSLALRFGGRSDQVLERMAAFMRDVAQARNELTASSAEVRLSAWILALLPVGIAGFIIVANNNLFMGLWQDPQGFRMLLTAVCLQIGGCYWLYRMAKGI